MICILQSSVNFSLLSVDIAKIFDISPDSLHDATLVFGTFFGTLALNQAYLRLRNKVTIQLDSPVIRELEHLANKKISNSDDLISILGSLVSKVEIIEQSNKEQGNKISQLQENLINNDKKLEDTIEQLQQLKKEVNNKSSCAIF